MALAVFRLAHISDLHIGPLPPVTFRDLLGKRLLGYVSWRSRRHRVHRHEILEVLIRDLHDTAPDHVAITGDLVNIALAREFELVAAWLRKLGPPDWISVVPGNHDALIRIDDRRSLAHWADYMASDRGTAPAPDAGSRFPYLRRRGPLALIGLSTAIPTPPGIAVGRLGPLQLRALDNLLARFADEDRCRIVLLHHPPLPGRGAWRRGLVDARQFRAITARHGVALILHGHEHALSIREIPGASGPIPVVGVPSASTLDERPDRCAQYQIYAIERRPEGWQIQIQTRGFDPGSGTFTLRSARMLGQPTAPVDASSRPREANPALSC